MPDAVQKLILVTGLSGGGKSTALRALEDLGCYCVDNLPAALLPEFAAQIKLNPSRYSRVALGVDARSPGHDLKELTLWLDQLE
ncbi:RNase adapter RapZ, partial [Pseudomonadota bacterium]